MDPSERSALIRQGRLLEAEHQEHVKRAAILLDAKSCWRNNKILSASDRRNPEYILLALQSESVPAQLTWSSFHYSCPRHLQSDREILLQRLELDDFERTFMDRTYRVPNVFKDDKEVMLKVVSKNSNALFQASEELQNDRDVVLTAIQNKNPAAPLAIQHASKKLRGDKRIARVLLQHEYGIRAFPFLSKRLQNDYHLAMLAVTSSSEECSKSYEHLTFLPEEMLDDPEIVYEACKRRGSNLRVVTDMSLLEDADIVMVACKNDGAAIKYCPEGPIRNELLQDTKLPTLIKNGGYPILEELGEKYMKKSKFLIPAVESGMVLDSKFSAKLFKKHRTIFMQVLRHSKRPFEQLDQLPDDLRSNPDIGMAILKAKGFDKSSYAFRLVEGIPDELFRTYIPQLLSIARTGCTRGADGEIWDEKAIVISLVKLDDCLSKVSARLKADPDVARAAFSRKGGVYLHSFKSIPQTVFQQHHDIAAMALKAIICYGSPSYNTCAEVYRHFGDTVARCRGVFLEWVRKGWRAKYHYGRMIPFVGDRDVALEAIKNTNGETAVSDILSQFSPSLLRDRDFMLSAIDVDPEVFRLANPKLLLDDFEYMLRGISSSRHVLMHYSHKGANFDKLADFAAEVRGRLAESDGFIIHFLGAITLEGSSGGKRKKRRRNQRRLDDRCHLGMLDLGYETGSVIKRSIAEFAGVPIGPDLKLMRSALENLKFWGY